MMEADNVVPMPARSGDAAGTVGAAGTAGTAGTAHDARSSAIAAVMDRVKGAWLAWRAWRRERDDLRALCALDDRTLRDLGLGRDDVGALARRHDARGADRPRAQRAQSSWIT